MNIAAKTGVKGDSYYGKVARNYQKRRTKQEWWHVEHEAMRDLLAKLPDDLSVVDVPFGTGRFVPLYREKGFTISGLDSSADMLATAQAELGDEFNGCQVTTGTATALPYADESFDLIVSTRFLRDIITFKDAMQSLQEFARVTRKYGIIQLGQHSGKKGARVKDLDPDQPMLSHLKADQNVLILKKFGLKVLDKKLVKNDPPMESEVYHFFVEKA